MLYSSLVDADSLDTERHFEKEQYDARPQLSLDVDVLLDALNHKFSSFSLESSLNKLRTEVRLYAQSLAAQPQGCFSMTLPTGMGKTLCSLNWALHHAKVHSNIKRIVIVLPFLSIIDQTAKELKSIFKDHDVILEHHSNVIYEGKESEEEEFYCKDPKQLATENWDYPIVVTTTVQFFESLFSNQRSKCRKLHNLQDSIVIFDEIQTLPVHLAECTMKILNDMLHLCRCSILFCTATQPNFQTRADFKGIDRIVPLVENPTAIFAATKRVEYYPIADYEVQSIDSIAQKVCEEKEPALIVCNTKKKAKALFDIIKEKGNMQVLHLSTNMCQKHRMAVIDKVKSKLKNGEKLILCSTQLIEAGVDIDFPIVFRELAPLESIIQSAGRCNREGKLEKGKVFLFQLEEKGQPSAEYKTFTQFAQLCYHNNENRLTDADFYAEYYTDIVKLYAPEDTITPKREKLMFQDVADKYQIIDSSATSLFVYRYNEESLQLYKEITNKEYLSRKDYQQIAQYCVQVYSKFKRDNSDKIAETTNGVKVWSGAYSEEFGLNNEEEILYI
jgi:CRISPR-associated endonuclease/helicase Cas3